MTSISTALEKKDATPSGLIERYRADFALVLPTHVKPDQWVRLCQGIMRRNQSLARVAQANPGSFLSALLDCARLGLEPGDTYHLVPYGNEIVGIPDWTGLVELIYRAGAVSSVKAEIVYERDVFHWEPGTMERPQHQADWFGDRGELVGVYAYAVMKDGSTSRVVVMSKKEIDKVKAVSKTSSSKSSPWVQWYDRMALKTAVRQLQKWLPTSAEYREQILAGLTAATDAGDRLGVPASTTEIADGDVVDAEIIHDETPSADPDEDLGRPFDDGDPGPGGWDE